MPKFSSEHQLRFLDQLSPVARKYEEEIQVEELDTCSRAYYQIAKDLNCFLDMSDLSLGINTITRCRNLLQRAVTTVLKFFGETPSETDHFQNQQALQNILPLETLLHCYIECVRIAGTEHHSNLSRKEDDHEVMGVLNLVIHCLERFYEILRTNGEKELVIFHSLGLDFENVPKLSVKPKFEYKKLQIKDEKLKENIFPISFLSVARESRESSPRDSPSDDEPLKIVGQDEKGTPCMENACGLICEYSGCPRTHGGRNLVYWPLTKIGSKQCCRGHKCEKNTKRLQMKNGLYVSICPDLHKDDLDANKTELGRRWKLFSEGKLSYDGIFK
jgi:hypothetical protein